MYACNFSLKRYTTFVLAELRNASSFQSRWRNGFIPPKMRGLQAVKDVEH